MNKFEQFACSEIFSSYPDNFSFEEIIELCNDDDKREKWNNENEEDQLELCELYENEDWEHIPQILEGLIDNAKHHLGLTFDVENVQNLIQKFEAMPFQKLISINISLAAVIARKYSSHLVDGEKI